MELAQIWSRLQNTSELNAYQVWGWMAAWVKRKWSICRHKAKLQLETTWNYLKQLETTEQALSKVMSTCTLAHVSYVLPLGGFIISHWPIKRGSKSQAHTILIQNDTLQYKFQVILVIHTAKLLQLASTDLWHPARYSYVEHGMWEQWSHLDWTSKQHAGRYRLRDTN